MTNLATIGRRIAPNLLAAALVLLAATAAFAFQKSALDIVSKSGTHKFTVELAISPEEQELGLQFRQELPAGTGMLFDFGREESASFWMKNTYVPLDLIFIRGNGEISKIAENAPPLSLDLIPSGGPARAVLEVIGGTSKKLGIAAGDRVVHPIFSRP
jgi:uncharacterized membrane protein (UPF0127 family)